MIKLSSVGGVCLCVRNSYISKSGCNDDGRTGGATLKVSGSAMMKAAVARQGGGRQNQWRDDEGKVVQQFREWRLEDEVRGGVRKAAVAG